MNMSRKIISSILGVVIIFCYIIGLYSITVHAEVEKEVMSYEKYDFYVKIVSDNSKTVNWLMEDKSFNDTKDSGLKYDHLTGEDMEFYPKLKDGGSSNLKASVGSIM